MTTSRIRFGTQPGSPALAGPGIALKAERREYPLAGGPVWIHGCCRLAKEELAGDRKDLLRGVFVTAVEAFRQNPATAALLGEHLVFDDDVEDAGDDYLAFFSFDLMETVPMPRAPFSFTVHASFFRHVSNVLFIRFTG